MAFPGAPSPTPTPEGPSANPAAGMPPIGSSPATQPVADRGMQAAGLAKIQVVVKLLESILPMVGAGTDSGKAVLESLSKLAKLIQPGSVSPGVEQSALSGLQNQNRQQAPQIAAMRAAAGGPGMGQPGPSGGQPQIPPGLAAMMQRPQGSA